MSWEFEKVAGPFEGPCYGLAWDGEALLVSVIELGTVVPKSRIVRYDPKSGETSDSRLYTNRVYGLGFSSDGKLFGAQAGSRRIVQYHRDGSATVPQDKLDDGRWHNQPHALAVDAKGRVWFSDIYSSLPVAGPHLQAPLEHTSVMRLEQHGDKSWHVRRMTYDTTAPRGVAISPDQKTLYVAESSQSPEGKRELRAYPILDDGTLGPCTVLLAFGADYRGAHRGADGLCVDAEGNVIAVAGSRTAGAGPMVYVVSPTGQVLESHPLPGDRPANCAFGDAGLGTLYVTTEEGELYRARNTGRRG